MNKRHYEHTLPNIRGSLSNTYTATHRKHLQASGLTGPAYGNMPALQQGNHSRVPDRPVPFIGNNHRIPLQGIPPCDKSHPYPVRHGHACITPKIQKT